MEYKDRVLKNTDGLLSKDSEINREIKESGCAKNKYLDKLTERV